jgi:UDP-N-acetylmuramate--alanine ligase
VIPRGTHVHFIGIGGSGMSAIASVLLARGYRVSGSDLRESEATRRLRALGARIEIGHAPGHVAPGQVVVISRAVPEENVEIQAALRQGLPIMHRAQMLADLMSEMRAIAVVGTHGKTTTASMIALIFAQAGRDPTALIGASVEDFGGNARIGRGPDLVAEVDESDGSLLWIAPRIAVVTPLDATDHLDFYGSEERLGETFRRFLNSLPPDGCAVVCVDAGIGRRLATGIRPRAVTYGLQEDASYGARIVEMAGRRTVFEARRRGTVLGQVTLAIPGPYNVQNALGALAVAMEVGIPFDAGASALGAFRGARRRFSVRGEIGGVLVVDDYAHNPTKVRALLEGARRCWPDARIVAVFQPHRYSRTRTVGAQFAEAFDSADQVIITEIYPADEVPIPGIDAGIIVRAIGARRPVRFIADPSSVAAQLVGELRPGDLVLTIGAGDIWKVADDLVGRLRAAKPDGSCESGAGVRMPPPTAPCADPDRQGTAVDG